MNGLPIVGTPVRRDGRGFSLLELLTAVAIILIISAVAIPNFLRSRIAANQASAVQSCRVVNSAEITYLSTYGQGYASALAALGPPSGGAQATASAAGYIDSVLVTGAKSGYLFTYTPVNSDGSGNYQGYTLSAAPSTPGLSGHAYYFTDQTYVIRANNSSTASSSDSPIGQ
jgi:type IV pilus assembly protein PilA